MTGKLDGNAIEDGTIDSTRLTSELSNSVGFIKVSSIAYPNSSSNVLTTGNDVIELIGNGFDSNANVYINFNLVSNITVTNSSSISVTTPAQNAGIYILQVKNPNGECIDIIPGIEYAEPPVPVFQGTTSGYTSGGQLAPGTRENTIEKFSFASDANATDVGNLTVSRVSAAGQSSTTHGYSSGGSLAPPTPTPTVNVIDRFPFASDANATDVGDLTQVRFGGAAQSKTVSNGYTSGGIGPFTSYVNTIDKFPFATNSNASDVGDLSQTRGSATGQSSDVSGYSSGGSVSLLTYSNVIDKFPFATNANATDVGDLSQTRSSAAGQSSADDGYTSGGHNRGPPATVVNTIDKFPFASDANATDVGDISISRQNPAGQSSTTNGYTSGGVGNPPAAVGISNVIDKFPFASNANATDVGNLTVARQGNAGQQV